MIVSYRVSQRDYYVFRSIIHIFIDIFELNVSPIAGRSGLTEVDKQVDSSSSVKVASIQRSVKNNVSIATKNLGEHFPLGIEGVSGTTRSSRLSPRQNRLAPICTA